MTPLLSLKRVSYTYRSHRDTVTAVRDFSLDVYSGESVSLMGPSGSGKSTVLLIAGLLMSADDGEVLIEGSSAPTSQRDRAALRNGFFGFVFQDYAIIDDLPVWENVALPLEYLPDPMLRRRRRARAIEELERYGIAHLARRRAFDLSGGQRQRVSIARATVNNPTIILADEPTAALDTDSCADVLRVFDELREAGKSIVVATHDPRVAERSDRTVVLR